MKRILAVLFFLFSVNLDVQCQTGTLTVYGKVIHKDENVGSVNIEIHQDNDLLKELNSYANGSFKVELVLGSVYNIAFKKENYIDKSVAVIAKMDSTGKLSGRFFFQLDIEMFKSDDNELDESLLPPVAKLYIRNLKNGFQYDKKYVKWVANKYEEELTD